MFKKAISCALIAGLTMASVAGFTMTAAASEGGTLNVQFVPTNNDGSMEAKAGPFADYLSEKLDMDVTVTLATDYTTIIEAMASGKVDLGIMPPAAYVLARDQGAAEAILTSQLDAYDEETELPIEGEYTSTFKGEVLVAADSDMESLEDLVGMKIATLSPTSASGYIYPVAEMKEIGIDPVTDCTLTTVNDVPSMITAVLTGQQDALFTFQGTRYVFNDTFSEYDLYDDLKVLYLTEGDIPNDAIAVQPDMDEELKEEIKDVFLNMANDEEGAEAMSLWGHTGYGEVDENAYDTIEAYTDLAAE